MARQLKPAMLEWLDSKLASNGLAQHAIAEKDARQVFILAAEACVGIYEVGGNNRGPMVELIQSTLGSAEREPWCMAAVQTWLAYAEEKTGLYSPIYPSEHCMTVLQKTPQAQLVKASPLKGAIVIWQHEGTSSGHTGIVIEATKPQSFTSIEGNSSGAGGRDGDCVGVHRRDWVRNGSLIRKAFLKPF